MKTIALAWRYLWSRPLSAGLNLLLLSLGLASLSFVLLASHQIDQAFERDLAGIDVVVGAKGGPMPESMVEVKTQKPVDYSMDVVVVEGRLQVLQDDPYGLYYRISDAVPVK